MDFEQIRAFLNVASLRSFSEAGEKMFISQPTISVRIKALEEELGVKLFDRSKAREPSLTESGMIFLDYAQAVINLYDDCKEKLSDHRESASGLLYIGSSTVPGSYLLPGLLAAFRKIAPSIDFNINILDTTAVLEGVLNYSYDLGYVGLIKPDERLKYISLKEDELVLCVRKGLFQSGDYREGIPLNILQAQHLILREKGSATRRLLEKKLSENGLDLDGFDGVTCINSLEGVKQAVKAGLGVAVVSRLSVKEMVQAGFVDTYPVSGLDLSRFLYLVYHRSRVLGEAARKLRDFTIKEFTK